MQLWPPVADPSTLTRQVWDAHSAQSIPAFAKGLQLYSGMLAQCSLDRFRGDEPLPRPPMLGLPDPNLRTLATFITVNVRDWWVHGNALSLVTERNADGTARYRRWFPAHMWNATGPEVTGSIEYYLNGTYVPTANVEHIQRGAHETDYWRGVGVLEEHLEGLDGMGLQAAAERQNLKGGGVPSVAIIAPNPNMTEPELDTAGDKWEEKFRGPGRRPAILPNGSQVVPLAWNPHEGEMVAAREMSLVDMANILNLDSYWLGAKGGSHDYQSPGLMLEALVRISLGPVMTVFEQTWSHLWFPYGTDVRFGRDELTREDYASSLKTGVAASGGPVLTREEVRVYLGKPAEPVLGEFAAVPPALAAAAEPEEDTEPAPPALAAVPDEEEEAS